jgi:hypothetical protein
VFSAADRLEPRRRHLRGDARAAVTDRPPKNAGRRVASRFNSRDVFLVDWRFSRLEHPAETSADGSAEGRLGTYGVRDAACPISTG